jgi:Mrp family chromosome partitioning ATPase
MLGVDGDPEFVDGKLQPLTAWGMKVMSIGFLVDEAAPMIWRGPMAFLKIWDKWRKDGSMQGLELKG